MGNSSLSCHAFQASDWLAKWMPKSGSKALSAGNVPRHVYRCNIVLSSVLLYIFLGGLPVWLPHFYLTRRQPYVMLQCLPRGNAHFVIELMPATREKDSARQKNLFSEKWQALTTLHWKVLWTSTTTTFHHPTAVQGC